MRRLLTTGACLAAAACAAPAAGAPAPLPDEILVALPGREAAPLVVALPDGADAVAAAASLAREPGVLWAEPNAVFRAAAVPDDPFFDLQWGLRSTGQTVNGRTGTPGADIGAPLAWDRVTGDAGLIVGVVDGGVDLRHPDLLPNLPPNPGESGDGREANGVDDDGNGVVDDVRGWDFADGDADPTETDASGHGAHVTGVLAAAGGNGTGVTGVVQRAAVVPVRALDAEGAGNASEIAAAFRYAASRGARVVNASLGGDATSATIEAAIRDSPNTLFVVAAGNEGVDVDGGGRSYPCSSRAANVLCVTATDRDDRLPRFANVGRTSVDIGAPGVDVLSTVTGGYGYKTGTSMATPHVSGTAALALAASPGISTLQLREALLSSAVPLSALAGRTTSGGRLSAPGTLAALPAPAPGPPAVTGAPREVTTTSARLVGTTRPTGEPAVHYFEIGTTTAYGRRTPQRPSGSATALEAVVGGLTPGTTYHARLVTATLSGVGFGPDVAFTTAGGARPAAPAATAAAPVAEGAVARAALAVRRVGRSRLATLTLPWYAVVSGRLERRGARGGFTTLRGFRRRGLDAGAHAFALGRPAPGTYRVTFSVTRGAEVQTLTGGFRVSAPPASGLRVASRPSGIVARLSVRARARVAGRLLALRGGEAALVARIRPRTVAAGTARAVPVAAALPAGRYRLLLTVRLRDARRTLRDDFTVRPRGRDGEGVVFRTPTRER